MLVIVKKTLDLLIFSFGYGTIREWHSAIVFLYAYRQEVFMLFYFEKITEVMSKLERELMIEAPDEFLTIINLDLDNFKDLNDTLGHAIADNVVEAVENHIQTILSEDDFVGRVGGDEFIVCFNHLLSRAECEKKARNTMKIFTGNRFKTYLDQTTEVTASMGVVIIPKDGQNPIMDVLRDLETSLHVAKESGKNTYRIFDHSMEKILEDKAQIKADMIRAVDENQFELYYQPQLDLKTGAVSGFEALLRWHHPTKGILLPSEFIPIAEETNIIYDIGRLVLTKACRQLGEWQRNHYDVSLAVNLSGKQFRDPSIIDYILARIAENDINPNKLEIEITETAAISDFNYTVSVLNMLKSIGIKFSLDDFGTGYSSLSYLKQLPVDNLKIDKSFMDDVLEEDGRARHIVEMVIDLARVLNLSVIAEGVESKKQEVFLKDAKCNFAQGFLYSCPVPANIASAMVG